MSIESAKCVVYMERRGTVGNADRLAEGNGATTDMSRALQDD